MLSFFNSRFTIPSVSVFAIFHLLIGCHELVAQTTLLGQECAITREPVVKPPGNAGQVDPSMVLGRSRAPEKDDTITLVIRGHREGLDGKTWFEVQLNGTADVASKIMSVHYEFEVANSCASSLDRVNFHGTWHFRQIKAQGAGHSASVWFSPPQDSVVVGTVKAHVTLLTERHTYWFDSTSERVLSMRLPLVEENQVTADTTQGSE